MKSATRWKNHNSWPAYRMRWCISHPPGPIFPCSISPQLDQLSVRVRFFLQLVPASFMSQKNGCPNETRFCEPITTGLKDRRGHQKTYYFKNQKHEVRRPPVRKTNTNTTIYLVADNKQKAAAATAAAVAQDGCWRSRAGAFRSRSSNTCASYRLPVACPISFRKR